MTDVMRVVKNLFKLGLVALQYSIVYLNLDVHSKVLRDFVKSETPKHENPKKVNEFTTKSWDVVATPKKQEQERGESDAPPYIGHGKNVRAFSRKDINKEEDKLHEWLP